MKGYKCGQRCERDWLLVHLVVVHAVLMFYLAKHKIVIKQKQLDVNVGTLGDGRCCG